MNNPGEDANHPNPQDTQSETTLLVIPGTNGAPPRIVTAFNDSGSLDPFGGLTVQSAPESKLTGYSLSTDGGTSFTDQGTLPTNLNGDIGEPTLARDDQSGTVYLTTVPFGQVINAAALSVFRSYDGGATFSLPVNAAPGVNPFDFIDKPWSTVDNFPGTGRGNVYEAFTDIGQSERVLFTRSTQAGRSWGPSGGKLIADGGTGTATGAYVTVGPDHAVYVFWLQQSGIKNSPNLIRMVKSTDQGVTFGAPVTVATLTTTNPGGDLGLIGFHGNPFRTNGFPQAVVNPANPKEIYLVYNDLGTKTGDKADIYLVQSSDGGSTWSGRMRVNNDSTTNDQWQPSVAVTPDGTHLGVFWYDRRADPKDVLIDRFGAIVDLRLGGPVAFPTNFTYNEVAFPPVNGLDPVIVPNYMGDYDQTVADNQFFYTTWGDNRSPSAVHAGHNADVRFSKIPVAGPFTTPANVLVNNPIEAPLKSPADTQSETALVVVPGATPTIVSAFNDSGSLNFDRARTDPANHFIGYSQSTNGGVSFIDKGTLPASSMGDASDPVLARDDVSGKIYLSVVPYAQLVAGVAAVSVFPSSNNGASFGKSVDSAPGFSGSDFLDKPWIAVDNAVGKGQGNVYQVFTDIATTGGGVFLTRSTDGGASWGPSGGTRIASADFANSLTEGADVVVGADHSVYVFYFLQDLFSGSARIVMRKSTDFGVTFEHPILVTTLRTTGASGDLGLNDATGRSFRTNAFPQAAVNPVTGAIYVVYNDVGTAPGDKADVYFRQSRDGGATWGRQIKVNDDKTTNDQWQPGLAVTPDGTRVGVFWYDRRADPGNNLIDRFGSIAILNGGGVSFGTNFRVTTHSFAPVFGQDPLVASNYMGDYDQVAADNQFFYTTWGDNSLPSQTHAGVNADVRFAKIPVNTKPPALQPVMAALGTSGAEFTGAPGDRSLSVNETANATPRAVDDSTHNTTPPSISVETASSGWPLSSTEAIRHRAAENSVGDGLASAELDAFFTSPVSFFRAPPGGITDSNR